MTNHRQTIERYFRAFRERDRDAMIAVIWPGVGSCWATEIEV